MKTRPIHYCGGGYYHYGFGMVDGRPHFKCSKCGTSWTNGLSGGEEAVALNLDPDMLTQAKAIATNKLLSGDERAVALIKLRKTHS